MDGNTQDFAVPKYFSCCVLWETLRWSVEVLLFTGSKEIIIWRSRLRQTQLLVSLRVGLYT